MTDIDVKNFKGIDIDENDPSVNYWGGVSLVFEDYSINMSFEDFEELKNKIK